MRDSEIIRDTVGDGIEAIRVEILISMLNPLSRREAFWGDEYSVGEEGGCALELQADGGVEEGRMRGGDIVG